MPQVSLNSMTTADPIAETHFFGAFISAGFCVRGIPVKPDPMLEAPASKYGLALDVAPPGPNACRGGGPPAEYG